MFDNKLCRKVKFIYVLGQLADECLKHQQAEVLRIEEEKKEKQKRERRAVEKDRIEQLKKSHPEYSASKLPRVKFYFDL